MRKIQLIFAVILFTCLMMSELTADSCTPNWTELTPDTQPSVRSSASMAFDTATGQLILFGGNSNGTFLNDTWNWDGTNWIQLHPTTSPSAREGAAMAFDPTTG